MAGEAGSRLQRRRNRVIGVVGALIVIVGVGAALGSALTDSDADSAEPPVPVNPSGITPIDGLSPRSGPATAVVGASLFIFGGLASGHAAVLNDGVLTSTITTETQTLPDSPFNPGVYAPAAVTVGNQVVVTGISCGFRGGFEEEPACKPGTSVAAVLDTGGGDLRWHTVPGIPNPKAMVGTYALGATSDGRAIFVFGQRYDQTFWSFNPKSEQWKQLARPSAEPLAVCMSGDTLITLSTSYYNSGALLPRDPIITMQPGGGGGIADGHVLPMISSVDLVNNTSWRTSPPSPQFRTQSPPTLACMKNGAFIVDPSKLANALTYAITTRTWSTPSAPPTNTFFSASAWTGNELMFIPNESPSGTTIGYAPSNNAWRTVPGFPPNTRTLRPLWNGRAIVGYADPVRVASGRSAFGLLVFTLKEVNP